MKNKVHVIHGKPKRTCTLSSFIIDLNTKHEGIFVVSRRQQSTGTEEEMRPKPKKTLFLHSKPVLNNVC